MCPLSRWDATRRVCRRSSTKSPALETADYEVVGVEHNVAALTECFRGAKVVCNMVGPFIKYGPETVEAALGGGLSLSRIRPASRTGCSKPRPNGASKFAAKGLLLSPGVAQMYTTGEIAAPLCPGAPGLDTLDILDAVGAASRPTASTQTIFTILKAKWYYLEQKQYKEWPLTQDLRGQRPRPALHVAGVALGWYQSIRFGSRTTRGLRTSRSPQACSRAKSWRAWSQR